MPHRTLILVAAVLLFALGGSAQAQHQPPVAAAAATAPFGFKAYGEFRSMISERNYLAVVALKDAADGGAADAVGAVSGLRGEISMLDGRLIVSYGTDCGTARPPAAVETATLLVTAAARHWRAIPIGKDLDRQAIEVFIRQQAKLGGLDENKPFPFRISGTLTDFVMHVNAAPNPRFKGHGSFDEMAITGLAKGSRRAGNVVGFYAPLALQGVITNGGEFFHSHYVDEQRAMTAHLDAFGIAAGSTLMLPREE